MSGRTVLWKMQPDNFTPPSRTPWGGRHIPSWLKAESATSHVVGESWEVSVEPSFPSHIVNLEGSPTLRAQIDLDPPFALGKAHAHHGLALLVKILDAADALSVQVHPAHADPALLPHQSGKPEAWIVIRHDPGAVLYLGFQDGIGRERVESALSAGESLEPLMNRVPVSVGDCFEIGPGVVHAIGAGVTLVEPQSVAAGREGVTYRLWDWGRRYDAEGLPSKTGSPRALHVQESLRVSRFSTDDRGGDAFRRLPKTVLQSGPALWERVIDNPDLRVDLLRGAGEFRMAHPTLLAFTVIEGKVALETAGERLVLNRGESGVVAVGRDEELVVDLESAWVVLSSQGVKP